MEGRKRQNDMKWVRIDMHVEKDEQEKEETEDLEYEGTQRTVKQQLILQPVTAFTCFQPVMT